MFTFSKHVFLREYGTHFCLLQENCKKKWSAAWSADVEYPSRERMRGGGAAGAEVICLSCSDLWKFEWLLSKTVTLKKNRNNNSNLRNNLIIIISKETFGGDMS